MTASIKSLAFLFPGQGSQFVGMGKDFFDQSDLGKRFFSQADEILGFGLSTLCFDGPEDTLRDTINTQPALYVCSVIACELLQQKGIKPSLVAGHSLGEYSALFCAGVFDFVTGLRLVRKRGELMKRASTQHPGTMAAIMGVDFSSIKTLCDDVSRQTGKVVCPANFNSPKQLVISGDAEAVGFAMKKASEQGARRVIPLNVSGAFHSPLMASAAEEFKAFLDEQSFENATLTFINNADASVLSSGDNIKSSLARQLTSCVLWTDTIIKSTSMGYKHFLEVGPGKVLNGLLKQIDTSINGYPAGNIESIKQTISSWS